MNNSELLGTSLDIEKVMSHVAKKNAIDSTQAILSRERGEHEKEGDKEVSFEREISGMYKCPGCLMLYKTKTALDTHWFNTCERVLVRERLGYTIGSSVDSELDSDSESEMDSETDSKTGDNRLPVKPSLNATPVTEIALQDDESDAYEDIKCESCNQHFACSQQLDTHYFDFHTSFVQAPLMTSAGISLVTIPRNQSLKFKCPVCFISFDTATKTRNHLMDICMSTQKDKQCIRCLTSFADAEKLKDHMNAFHQSEIELECPVSPVSENIVSSTSSAPSTTASSSSSPLSSSLSSPPSSPSLSSSSPSLSLAPLCPKNTTIKYNVKRDSRKKFKCPLCPCLFSSTVAIRHHANTFCRWKELHIDDYNIQSRKQRRT